MTISFRELSNKFLAWSKLHQAPRSHEYYEGYIQKYLKYIGDKADEPASSMKPYQIEEWVDNGRKSNGKPWSDNYKRGGVVAINTVFNRCIKSGYIDINPIKTTHKPSARSRQTFATPADVEKILAHISPDDPFHDYVTFLWYSFVRPQEVRHIEARHVDLTSRQINFPAIESKGKRHPRCILIFNTTYPIIEKLVAKYPEGKIFRCTRGTAWTKYAVCARFQELSIKIGKKITAYDLRHGIITAALEDGKNHMDVAAASGHVDGSMIGKCYSHVHANKDRVRNVFEGMITLQQK